MPPTTGGNKMKTMRPVTITPVLNGFIVRVGCQTLVFNKIEVVAANLVEYQKNPERVSKEFIENAVNKTMEVPAPGIADPYTAREATPGLQGNGGGYQR
jgi:hypothetical protein